MLSEFLCKLANTSQRPESVLKTSISAFACLLEALGKVSHTNNSDIKRLVTGLVKTQIFTHMCRSKPMPVEPFINSFTTWGDNSIGETVKVKDDNSFSSGLYDQTIRFGP